MPPCVGSLGASLSGKLQVRCGALKVEGGPQDDACKRAMLGAHVRCDLDVLALQGLVRHTLPQHCQCAWDGQLPYGMCCTGCNGRSA